MRGVHADTFGKRLGSHLLQKLDYPSASPANASPWYLSHIPAISCKPLTGSLKGAHRFPDSSFSWGKEMCVSAEARDENCVFSSGVALRGKKRKKEKKIGKENKQALQPSVHFSISKHKLLVFLCSPCCDNTTSCLSQDNKGQESEWALFSQKTLIKLSVSRRKRPVLSLPSEPGGIVHF